MIFQLNTLVITSRVIVSFDLFSDLVSVRHRTKTTKPLMWLLRNSL